MWSCNYLESLILLKKKKKEKKERKPELTENQIKKKIQML